MVILAIGILGYPGRRRQLLPTGEVIHQQGNDGFGAGHQPGRVYPEIEMVFHVLHGALHAFIQPGFQAAGIVIQHYRAGNAAVVKTQFPGPLLYTTRMIII